jgi:hypothetical protein
MFGRGYASRLRLLGSTFGIDWLHQLGSPPFPMIAAIMGVILFNVVTTVSTLQRINPYSKSVRMRLCVHQWGIFRLGPSLGRTCFAWSRINPRAWAGRSGIGLKPELSPSVDIFSSATSPPVHRATPYDEFEMEGNSK